MYARVKAVDFSGYKRIIVISDVHGDSEGFRSVLEKVAFGREDALVIVGDILEKGQNSLELLHMVMNLYARGNVYAVLGNNDTIFTEWLNGLVSVEDVLWYVTNRKYSIIMDMAKLLGLPYEDKIQIERLREEIQKHFKEEICFLDELPHIIDSDAAVFVHAGIKPGDLNQQDPEYCLTAKAFAAQKHVFSKPVIVGHWPCSCYSRDRIDANVQRFSDTNVICIDGGNSMKVWQQINYLILESSGRELECGYYDNLPRIRALEDQAESTEHIALVFPNTAVEIRENGEKVRCYIPYLQEEIILEKNRIYHYKGQAYCSDMTTYDVPVRAGEILTLCRKTSEGVMVKRDGIVGNYHGRYEEI